MDICMLLAAEQAARADWRIGGTAGVIYLYCKPYLFCSGVV